MATHAFSWHWQFHARTLRPPNKNGSIQTSQIFNDYCSQLALPARCSNRYHQPALRCFRPLINGRMAGSNPAPGTTGAVVAVAVANLILSGGRPVPLTAMTTREFAIIHALCRLRSNDAPNANFFCSAQRRDLTRAAASTGENIVPRSFDSRLYAISCDVGLEA